MKYFIFIIVSLNCLFCIASEKTKSTWDIAGCSNNSRFADFKKIGIKATQLSEADLLSKLRGQMISTDKKKEFLCSALAQSLPAQSGKVLAIVETQVFEKTIAKDIYNTGNTEGVSEENRCLYLGLLSNGQVEAKGMFCLNERVSFDHFDFANYKITDKEKAFGVRTFVWMPNGVKSAGGYDDYLLLFRIEKGEIHQIFETLVMMSSGDDYAYGSYDSPALISMLKNKTQNFFDIKKKIGKKSMIYKWNGAKYESKELEIVTEYDPKK